MNEQQSVTIEIEIFFSHLMYAPEYTPLDDIVRKQKQQIMYVLFFMLIFKAKNLSVGTGVNYKQHKTKIFN